MSRVYYAYNTTTGEIMECSADTIAPLMSALRRVYEPAGGRWPHGNRVNHMLLETGTFEVDAYNVYDRENQHLVIGTKDNTK
jgi:hypothetical protein